MHNFSNFLEFDFDKNISCDCRFDSSTLDYGVVSYKLAITHWPFYSDAQKLHFSSSSGLKSELNSETDIVSQLLSLRELKTNSVSNADEEYNSKLVKIFEKYGFLTTTDSDRVVTIDRSEIDNYIELVYLINEVFVSISKPAPLTQKVGDKLLRDITSLLFVEFKTGLFHIDSFPLLSYLDGDKQEYDPDEDFYYCMKGIQFAYYEQISDYESIERYNPQDVILNAYELLKNQLSKQSGEIISFFYKHIKEKHFRIVTNEKTGINSLEDINFPYKENSEELIAIADKICNYFLSQASRNAPLILVNEFKNNAYKRHLEYDIKQLSDAILLSLLFFEPTKQEFRKCNLPTCNNFFLTNCSNTKKIYCCRSHARTAATQHRRHPEQT